MEIHTKTDLVRSLHRHLVVGAAAIIFLFAGVGGWAMNTELSSAIIAPGILKVDGNAKKVQHLSGGIVSELLTREGQTVEIGDVLIRLDATVAKANLITTSHKLNQLYARQARLEAERDTQRLVIVPPELLSRLSLSDAEPLMASERRLFEDRRISREGQKTRLREQIKQLQQQIIGVEEQRNAKTDEIGLIEQELSGLRRLYASGAIPLSRVNNLDRNVARLRGEYGQLVASIASAQTRISETEVQLLQIDQQMHAEVATELRDVKNQQVELRGQEVTVLNEVKLLDIKAPIAGVVHQLAVHTIGGVITAAEPLMQIVPQESTLTVEARIAPQDIDQLAVGQSTTLQLTAFNRNTTPEIAGSVIRISADLETDQMTGTSFYKAGIALRDDDTRRTDEIGLVPGMPVDAFIRTGDRKVISYFTKPLRDHMQRVFREE
ncbi:MULTISPECIES: HlyD family type I secretion periplasmic adaptor subunit [Agrobacterium]|nr:MULTISPECIES: HlyD family type I secretion periplasmic adaptor subunit [Agrobacterium]MCZ7889919.1 HlyD family type I secretion periplasmic adaptor subunit [Agrobacterium salinitolerans]MDA5629472.1 HlyD family type I secretion periplasmic adaptor subunit [Agrobacterium sp. ST15.16.055]MDA6982440.1 HlyD family type I secretion periplasmic adaptor subunit [Agrobacterium salinitolerans]